MSDNPVPASRDKWSYHAIGGTARSYRAPLNNALSGTPVDLWIATAVGPEAGSPDAARMIVRSGIPDSPDSHCHDLRARRCQTLSGVSGLRLM